MDATRIFRLTVPAELVLCPSIRAMCRSFLAVSWPDADAIARFDHGFGELLQNALEWGTEEVRIKLRFFRAGCAFYLRDDGPGFDLAKTLASEKVMDTLRGDHYGLMYAEGFLSTVRGYRPPEGGMVVSGFMSLAAEEGSESIGGPRAISEPVSAEEEGA